MFEMRSLPCPSCERLLIIEASDTDTCPNCKVVIELHDDFMLDLTSGDFTQVQFLELAFQPK